VAASGVRVSSRENGAMWPRLGTSTALVLMMGTSALLLSCTSEADRQYRRAKDSARVEGDFAKAISHVDAAIELRPDRGNYRRSRGVWLEELGRSDDALEAYDDAIAAERPSRSAHHRAIALCLRIGRLDEAEERIERAEVTLEEDDLEELAEAREELNRFRAVARAREAEHSSSEGFAQVEWNLTNEQNIAEFRVLRGESLEGPWTEVAAVAGLGEGLHGPQSYRHVDRGLEVGTRVYYLIEHEDTTGNALRAGPISHLVEAPPSPEGSALP
jgi:tetratricopeptide (TPR) repeat protein